MNNEKLKRPIYILTSRMLAIVLCLWVVVSVVAFLVRAETAKTRLAAQINASKASRPAPEGSASEVDKKIENLQSQLAILAAQSEALGKVLEAEREEIVHLENLATVLYTASGVFIIVLGIASWKTLEEQRKTAERALGDEKSRFENLRNELQLDFPMLGRIQNNFRGVLASLQSACLSLVELDDTYKSLTAEEIQEILFYEGAVTNALLLNTKGYEKELSEIYRMLGVFYGSRFNSIVGDDGKFNSVPTKDDFYRSRFYFDRAISLNPENYLLFMNAGFFSQYYDNETVADISKRYFQRASQLGVSYQRPMVAISLIELEAFQDPFKSLSMLAKASERNQYDKDSSDPRPGYLAYLQACALVLKAAQSKEAKRESIMTEALERLLEASNTPSSEWRAVRSFFNEDKKKYLAEFSNYPNLSDQATQAIDQLESYIFEQPATEDSTSARPLGRA